MKGLLFASYLLFFAPKFKEKEEKNMKAIKFNSLDDCICCYGRDRLVAIDNLSQIIFYTKHGCQPKFVFENECKPGRIAAWFLKDETSYVYKKWMLNAPKNDVI